MLLCLLAPIAQAAFPALSAPVDGDQVRLVIIGDTGALPTEVTVEGALRITDTVRQQIRGSIRDEQADAIVVLGDLVYGPGAAQLSPKCRDTDEVAEEWLDPALGDYFAGLPTTWLALGNHDVGHVRYSRRRARCLRDYAATTDNLRLPESAYTVDFGLGQLVVLDTNRPTGDWPSAEIQQRIARTDGWVIMGGHHVLKTTFDKESETAVRQWLSQTDIQPDLWINGHAHFLQFGVYDGIPSLTSGTGSKVRQRPECPGPECVGPEAPLFSRSIFGYAVVDLTADDLTVRIKDADGQAVYCWRKTRDGEGAACPTEEPEAPAAIPTAAVLGEAPLCEASAALTLADGSVLVADDEIDDALFSFRYISGSLTGQERLPFASREDRIEDIEALTATAAGVLVVGSHSRSRKCALQPERRRLVLGADRVKTSDAEWAAMTGSAQDCRERLFGGADGAAVGELCAAIVAAEQAEDCGDAFNIEGALTDATGRVWLGLRAPTVAGRGAAMVRLSEDFMGAEALSLDAVAWVTLPPDQGIRELRRDGDFILGIAGTTSGSELPMTLWRAPLGGLAPEARLSVTRVSALPAGSEGVTRVGGELIAVVDGDRPGDSSEGCQQPAGQVRIVEP